MIPCLTQDVCGKAYFTELEGTCDDSKFTKSEYAVFNNPNTSAPGIRNYHTKRAIEGAWSSDDITELDSDKVWAIKCKCNSVGHVDFLYPNNCESEGKREKLTMQRWTNLLQKHLNVKCQQFSLLQREKVKTREKYNLTRWTQTEQKDLRQLTCMLHRKFSPWFTVLHELLFLIMIMNVYVHLRLCSCIHVRIYNLIPKPPCFCLHSRGSNRKVVTSFLGSPPMKHKQWFCAGGKSLVFSHVTSVKGRKGIERQLHVGVGIPKKAQQEKERSSKYVTYIYLAIGRGGGK